MFSSETIVTRTPSRQHESVPGPVFSRSIIDARPDNAAPWRVEIEYGSGEPVSFDVQFRNRKTIPAGLSLQFLPTGPVT